MKKGVTKDKSKVFSQLYSDPRYRGKHVLVIDNKVYVAATGDEAARVFEEQTRKHPGKTPLVTYVPADNTLILIV